MKRYRTIVADPPWDHSDAPLGHQRSVSKSDFLPYASMSVDDICALPIGDLSAPGAHLYLWTTNRFVLHDAQRVMHSWGFTPATLLTWCKQPMGLGGGSEAFANTTEFVVWGRKRFGEMIRATRKEVGMSCAELERRVHGGVSTGLAQRWEENSAWPNPEHVDALSTVLGWDSSDFANPPSKRWKTTWFTWPRRQHSAKPEAFLDLVEETSPGPYLELFARRQRLGWDTWGDEAMEHVSLSRERSA